jgi:hypothetical protein
MGKLLDLEEMRRRHKDGEDPFDLIIEKWRRIREYLAERGDTQRYLEAFKSATDKILFCLDYKDRCLFCPLERICLDDQSLYHWVLQHLEAYASADPPLPAEPLMELIDSYIEDLERYREVWVRRSH